MATKSKSKSVKSISKAQHALQQAHAAAVDVVDTVVSYGPIADGYETGRSVAREVPVHKAVLFGGFFGLGYLVENVCMAAEGIASLFEGEEEPTPIPATSRR